MCGEHAVCAAARVRLCRPRDNWEERRNHDLLSRRLRRLLHELAPPFASGQLLAPVGDRWQPCARRGALGLRGVDTLARRTVEGTSPEYETSAPEPASSVLVRFCCEFAFSQREMRVLELASAGLSNKDIARGMCCSLRTVETYWVRMFRKSGIRSRHEILCELLSRALEPEPRT
jgi:DNA-binding CsgD family transcriptional regulator